MKTRPRGHNGDDAGIRLTVRDLTPEATGPPKAVRLVVSKPQRPAWMTAAVIVGGCELCTAAAVLVGLIAATLIGATIFVRIFGILTGVIAPSRKPGGQ